MILTEILDQ